MVTLAQLEEVRPKLTQHALRNGLSADDAADLAQEAIILVWRNGERVDPERGPTNYAFRVMLRLLDRHRRDQRRRNAVLECELDDADVAGLLSVSIDIPGEGPVMDAIRSLPEIYADVLLTVDVGGMSIAQYALRHRIAEGSVRSRLSRGRALVREGVLVRQRGYLN
jgi:RNA polymerase sigma-70 factor (ECF subfamily)